MFWWWAGILIAFGLVLLAAAALSTRRRPGRTEETRELSRTQFLRALSDLRQKRAEGALERALASNVVCRPLLPEDKERCRRQWREIQARFAVDPARAVAEADHLAEEVARLRGSEGLPPGIPARRVVFRAKRGQASPNDLRAAMQQYGAIVEDLLRNGLRATGS
jgi:hypothetical protein